MAILTEQSFLTASQNNDDDPTHTKNDKKVNHRSFSSLSYIIGTIVVGLVATIYLASGGGATSGNHMMLLSTNNNNSNNNNNNDEAAAASAGEISLLRLNGGNGGGVGGGVGSGGGGGDGNGGQEHLSSTSVGDNYDNSITKPFVEEEEEGGLQISCCYGETCKIHRNDTKACKEAGCFYYPDHFDYPYCSSCSGVSCGNHRSTECKYCPYYKGVDKGENYCNGDCEWYPGDFLAYFWANAGCYDK
eukprot:CAMPEP_0170923158 /NCGR_PEP_ID=MMETSP0735-20130129/10872_1 /TAXON_ID=186038 /ORGANISM="Fragilariopsis kerguelensis, Strain L26-C5" /LENGTH=245 /DNA_ID=CAMNT_0011322695 /DNA_START=110 /DNA_END=847 /DNA_ORIENTATION=-